MRSFIAIEIPGAVRAALNDIVRKLGTDSRGIRWVPVENIHLTLKFLGDVRDDLVPVLKDKIMLTGKHHQPFEVVIRGAGAFPNLRNPNVLWVGIEPSEKLAALFREIDVSLAEIGFERESRGFSPHLTIGRVRDKRGIGSVVKELATYKDNFFGTIEVREILLVKSVLNPAGAEYSKVAVIKLAEDNK